MEYILKVAIALSAGNLQDERTNDHIKEYINGCIQSYYMQTIISTHSAFKSAASSQHQLPVFVPNGDHLSKGGQIIRLSDIKTFIAGHLSHCQQSLQQIFGRVTLLDIPEGLTDNVSDSRPGTSIFSQNINAIINQTTVNQLWMNVYEEIARKYRFHSENGGMNEQAIVEFYNSKFEEFAKDLIVLIHITGGSPPRKTELALLRVSNDPQQKRNIFLDGTLIYFAIFYHKTTNKSDNFRPTFHFLPPSVSKLVFNFICFLRPAVITAMLQVNPEFP